MTALVYEMIYVLVCVTGLLSVSLPLIGIETFAVPILVITVLLAWVIPVLRRSSWTVRLIALGIMIALGVAAAFLLRSDSVREFLYGYKEYVYLPLVALGAMAAGEAFVYIRPLKILASAFLIGYMIWAAVTSYPVDKLMLFCVSALLIITVIEEMQRGWRKSGDTDNKRHLVYVMPFVLATIILILVCPAPEEPYDWKFVKNIANAIYELVLDIERKLTPSGLYDPTVSSIGFSGRGEITGNLAHQSDPVLELCDLTSSVKVMRLSGKTFDTFDGRAWHSTDPSVSDDAVMDTLAFLAAAGKYTDTPGDLAKRLTFRIEYSQLKSGYVFVPLKSLIGPEGTDGKQVSFNGGDMTWTSDEIPEHYYLTYYRQNLANPVFTDFLKNAEIPGKEEYEYRFADNSLSVTAGIGYEDYLAYREHIKEYYAGDVVLSDELRRYMDEVYEGCEDDIDKAVRLCELLRSFEYTDQPGPLPDYVTDASSMLDYFILESRRGYCTHFATAFVLLARAEGIPARFVQGYYVPTGGNRDVTVYTYMAHAWPEIYVDGAGWVVYEPTPGYGLGSNWYTEAQAREAYGNIGAGYEGYQGPEEDEFAEDAELIPEEAEEEEKPHVPWYVIVIPPVTGILFVILFILTGNMIVSAVFKRKETTTRYEILCRQILELLRILGMGTAPGETLREYGERISGEAGEEIFAFIGNLTLYLYAGGKDVEKYEKQALIYRNELLVRLRKERFFRYLTYYLGFQKVKNVKEG